MTLSAAEQLRDKLVRAQRACGETQSMLARLAVEPAAAPAPAPSRIAELRTGRGRGVGRGRGGGGGLLAALAGRSNGRDATPARIVVKDPPAAELMAKAEQLLRRAELAERALVASREETAELRALLDAKPNGSNGVAHHEDLNGSASC